MKTEDEKTLRGKVRGWYEGLSWDGRNDVAIDCSEGATGIRYDARLCLERIGLPRTRANVRVAGEQLLDLSEAEFQF